MEADILLAAKGSAVAYGRLVDSCRGLVASIALAIVRDVPASEEVAQDVFVGVWRALPGLRNPASFLPWLRQVTRNRARRFLAEARRRPAPADEALLAAAVDPAPGAEAGLLRAEELRAVSDALEELPDDAREIVVLYYREGRSVRQVSILLGLREDAVKKRLSRARARLREDVEARLAGAAERTAPGPAFTAAVLIALPKAGAGLAAGAVLKTAGLFVKPLVAALPGVLGAFIGIGSGLRKNLREARDAEERRGLWAATLFMGAVVLGFGVLVPLVPAMAHPKISLVALTCALMAGIDLSCLVWIPRVTARRIAAQLLEDPVGTREKLRRARRGSLIGVTLGTVLTWIPVIWFLLR